MTLSATIGADPEIFLVNQKDEWISSVGKIGGSKDAPAPLGKKGFFVQEDNVAVEFNIPPAKTVKEFVSSVDWSIKTITKRVGTFGLKPKIQAAALFPVEELLTQQAMTFGCDPDFNAWNDGMPNGRPSASDQKLRSCGGHLHIGINNKVPENLRQEWVLTMVKAMDFYLGVPSVLMDGDSTRRELYGAAGAFRYQKYAPVAFEYRVLSNFWLASPKLMKWAYEQTMMALRRVWKHGYKEFEGFLQQDDLGYKIQKAVNGSDLTLAQTLIEDYKLRTV